MNCKKRYSIFFCTLITSILFVCMTAVPVNCKQQSKNTTSTDWILKQTHLDTGNITTYISKDAVKMVLEREGFCLLAKAPSWTVYIFRPSEKTVWLGQPNELSPGTIGNAFNRPSPKKELPIKITKPDQYDRKDSIHQIVKFLGTGMQGAVSYTEYSAILRNKRKIVFRATRDIPIDPHGAQILCRIFGIPNISLVPTYLRSTILQNETYSAEHEKHRALPFFSKRLMQDVRIGPVVVVQTKDFKPTILDKSVFDLPSGYTRKLDIVDVTYSTARKAQLTEMLNEIGFESNKNDKKKRQK